MVNGSKSESAQLSWPATRLSLPRIQRRLNVGDSIFRGLTTVFALLLVGVLASIVLVLLFESWGSIRTFGWGFLTGSKWDPVFKEFGALPFIYGTLLSSLLALLQAVPLSIGTALVSERAVAGLAACPGVVPRRVAGHHSERRLRALGHLRACPLGARLRRAGAELDAGIPAVLPGSELRRRHAHGLDDPGGDDRALRHVGDPRSHSSRARTLSAKRRWRWVRRSGR